jgi:hypothetical protein
MTYAYATCQEPVCCHNRRYLMENRVSKMHPGGAGYPGRLMKEGPEDPQLQAIWFCREGQVKGILVNYSAHPSLLYGKKVTSSDYPGVMRRILKQVYGEDVAVIFLQGCAGNLTPRDHEGDANWAKGISGTERIGAILAADVIRMMSVTLEQEDTDRIRLISSKVRIDLREVSEEDVAGSDAIFRLLEEDRAAFDALDVGQKAYANKVRNLLAKWESGAFEEVPVSAIYLIDENGERLLPKDDEDMPSVAISLPGDLDYHFGLEVLEEDATDKTVSVTTNRPADEVTVRMDKNGRGFTVTFANPFIKNATVTVSANDGSSKTAHVYIKKAGGSHDAGDIFGQ